MAARAVSPQGPSVDFQLVDVEGFADVGEVVDASAVALDNDGVPEVAAGFVG